MQNPTLLSRTVAWLRFPLIVLVVLIHAFTGLPDENLSAFPLANLICFSIFRGGVCSVAVPLFFFIAGYFYFYKTETTWGVSVYLKKTRSRVRSLLVPFCVWGVLALAWTFLYFKATGDTNVRWTHVPWGKENSLLSLAISIFDAQGNGHSHPALGTFWFVRDLFVVGLFSPLWRVLLKTNVGAVALFVAIFGVKAAFPWLQVSGLSATSLLFFCAGALFAIRGRDFVADFSMPKIGVPACVAYFPMLVADVLTKNHSAINFVVHRAFIFVSMVAVVFVASRLVASGKVRESAFLSGSSFFVYAIHVPFCMTIFESCIRAFYVPASDVGVIAVYFSSAIFCVAVGLGAYWILRRFFAWSLPFLTGGR